jgi:hypothetical protein
MPSRKPALAVLFIACAVACLAAATSIPPSLRGGIECDKAAIGLALELNQQGWVYIMPQPKSPQAAWGNHDGRTTWWIGYWVNEGINATSQTQPTVDAKGVYVGDGGGGPHWRRGGSPPPPTKIEWLCSRSGGIPPH